MQNKSLAEAVQHNCDISDARDNGIYSICTLVLKLRNLYKWENHVAPWDEPEPKEILDWIAAREDYWATIEKNSFLPLPVHGNSVDPFHVAAVNTYLNTPSLVYGAGYGRSMKSVFFLAELFEERNVEGCPVVILDKEIAKELASPFAMLQDGTIYIRKDPLRFYLWDQIQEARPSGKLPLQYSLKLHRLLNYKGLLDRDLFKEKLGLIVEQELTTYIYHEIGELKDTTIDANLLKQIISIFPDSPIEFLARALKDILADTHPNGMISHILAERKESSLGFYVAFLDGLRKVLFPEIVDAFKDFVKNNNWQAIDLARKLCRDHVQKLAYTLQSIFSQPEKDPLTKLQQRVEKEMLAPLGLIAP